MSNEPGPARVRVPLRPVWWAAFVLVPLIIGLGSAYLERTTVESNLQTRVERGVLSAGVSQVTIAVDGRDVVATVPTDAAESTLATVRSAIGKVQGVGSVEVAR